MLTLSAQSVVMKVKLTDGDVVSYAASQVDSIYFVKGESAPKVVTGLASFAVSTATIPMSVTSDDDIVVEYYGIYYSTSSDMSDMMAVYGTETLTSGSFVTITLSGLSADTDYYYRAFVKLTSLSSPYVSDIANGTTLANSDYFVPTAIDLGLSVKWANFNLGASSAAEYGGLYGWGDATGESTSDNDFDYGWYTDSEGNIRYLMNTHIGGNADFDLATAKLGKGWRLPTPKEIEELNQCTRTYVANYEGSGISGYMFTSNGNSIFIPHAGFKSSPSAQSTDVGIYGYIWSDSIASTTAVRYKIMDGAFATANPAYKTRFSSIRPVYDATTPSSGGGGDSSDDEDLTNEVSVASSDATGLIPKAGVDMGTTVYGQKVYWARWNIGVTKKIGQFGRYYAWGELETKDSYTEDTYDVDFKGLMFDKFPNYQLPDSADVVHELWGENWRMPTIDEISALMNVCDITYTTDNGIYGCLLTSNSTGNSIFLPLGGYKSASNTLDENSRGYYWSSSVYSLGNDEKKSKYAYYGEFSNSSSDIYGLWRHLGMLIRPVWVE